MHIIFADDGTVVTDDIVAINRAISFGNRCSGDGCVGKTTTPAVVYFPPGIYLISTSILNYYYTQLIGDPNNMPTIKGAPSMANATTMCLLDGDPYGRGGALKFTSTNVFFRQVRNLIFDTTGVPGETCGIHWPSSQASSIHNCVFMLSNLPGTTHTGIFMEEGSGGLMNDLIFYGGKYGAQFGNQQFTMRNLTFVGCETAILQLWNWGWTYKSLSFINCGIGILMKPGNVGGVTLLNSKFTNVDIAIFTGRGLANTTGRGSLVMEGVEFVKVAVVLAGPGGVIIAGDRSARIFE
jgi:glucan 1,3-beta-glucosidase